jgi:acyl-CoA synthetase (AMP-forming)/AMP-acid ligase II
MKSLTHEIAPLMYSLLPKGSSDRSLRLLKSARAAKLIPFAFSEDEDKYSGRLFEMVTMLGELDSPHPSFCGGDGVYHTGDLFEEVAQGLYTFRGRSGDWIKTMSGFCDAK